MKPATAARKLGVHLDATPEEFRAGVVSRDELDALQADPPSGCASCDATARIRARSSRTWFDLGVSISGLARAEIVEPLTTAQIVALKEEQPEWLRRERGTRAEAARAEARLRAERSGRRRDDPVGG